MSKPRRDPSNPHAIPMEVDSGTVMVPVTPEQADEYYGDTEAAQGDTEALEDLAIVKAVIARQEEVLVLAAANAAPDAMGKDGLEDDRKVIAALKRAAGALATSLVAE